MSRLRICVSARSNSNFTMRARASSVSPQCTLSRPTTCLHSLGACARISPKPRYRGGSHAAGLIRRRSSYRKWTAGRDDGELVLPRVATRLTEATVYDCSGLCLHDGDGGKLYTEGETGTFALDQVSLPARHHVSKWRRQYACLAHRPVWLVETARGCPFRCSFCSIWQLHARAVRERSLESVCADFASVSQCSGRHRSWLILRAVSARYRMKRRGSRNSDARQSRASRGPSSEFP